MLISSNEVRFASQFAKNWNVMCVLQIKGGK